MTSKGSSQGDILKVISMGKGFVPEESVFAFR
jgi:hypothetical protein